MSGEREQGTVMSSNNIGFLSESVMRYRLDTRELLIDIEMQLRGQQIEYSRDEEGNILERVKTVGKAKMNDKGIQSVMSYLRSVLGSHTVQGNFDRDGYEDLIFEIDSNLSTDMMSNLHEWEIDVLDYNHVMNTIMHAIIPFLSRTIDNEERKSYAATMRSVESNSYQKGGFSIPNPFSKTQ